MRPFALCAVATALFCASCHVLVFDPVPFDPDAAAFIKKPGKTRVEGQAFVINGDGHRLPVAGQKVELAPVTPHSRRFFEALYDEDKGRPILGLLGPIRYDTDPRYAEFTRATKSDVNGKFAFDNVPPGDYFVSSSFWWEKDDFSLRGAMMYETVTVTGSEKEPAKVILSANSIGK
jgi:hypothetical protein